MQQASFDGTVRSRRARSPAPIGTHVALAVLAASLVAAPAAATLTFAVPQPATPLKAGGDPAALLGTVALDCATALQWSLANAAAANIPLQVASGSGDVAMSLTGPATVQLPLAPCQAPGAANTTAMVPLSLQAGAGAPAGVPVGGWARVTLPAAAVGGQTVVPSDMVNRTVTGSVEPILLVAAAAPVVTFNVTQETLDFNVTFSNLGNVALQVIVNTTSSAVLEIPVVNLGAASIPGSGPANVTATLRFHAPLGSWSEVRAHIEVVPQLQTIGAVLKGPPVALDLTFHNRIESDQKSPAAAPVFAAAALAMAAVIRRRPVA